MHVFSLDPPRSTSIAHRRNFAPLHGIDEESATGSSNGALVCYLFEKGTLPTSSKHKLLFRQDVSLNAPSTIYVHLKVREEKIEKVECGGEVVIDGKRELTVPPIRML